MEIQEYSKTEAALSLLREKYQGATYEVETTQGMKEAKEARAEVRTYRTDLEKMRKEIKGPALERCRLIDAEAQRITKELVAIEGPIDEQIKAHEAKLEAERQAKIEAEAKLVQDIQDRIANDIRGMAEAAARENKSSEALSVWINDLEAIAIDDFFAEFREQAQDAKDAALARLKDLRKGAVEREAEAARIAAERAELAKLREAEEKRLAEEKAKRDAEDAAARKKLEAEQKAERERLATQAKEQAAAQAKIDAENKRLAEQRAAMEKAERDSKEKKAAEERAEQARKAAAEAAARKSKYPGDQAIVDALVKHFGVTEKVVKVWLSQVRIAA